MVSKDTSPVPIQHSFGHTWDGNILNQMNWDFKEVESDFASFITAEKMTFHTLVCKTAVIHQYFTLLLRDRISISLKRRCFAPVEVGKTNQRESTCFKSYLIWVHTHSSRVASGCDNMDNRFRDMFYFFKTDDNSKEGPYVSRSDDFCDALANISHSSPG